MADVEIRGRRISDPLVRRIRHCIMTAFYMFRLVYLTFRGQPRMSHEAEHHIHESPKSMTGPLVVLAISRFLPVISVFRTA